MKNKYKLGTITGVVTLMLYIITTDFAPACNPPPGTQKISLTLAVTDTSTTAGTRTSGSTLKMVNKGSPRSASVTATVNGTVKSGYPTWTGTTGFTTYGAGSYNADYSGTLNANTRCTVYDGLNAGCYAAKSAYIEIVSDPNLNLSFDLDSSELSAIKDKLNTCLGVFDTEQTASLTYGGSLSGTYNKVDKYGSPNIGHKIVATSGISLGVSKLDGKLKIVNLGPISVNAFFEIDALTLTSSGTLSYDDSLEVPVSGSSDGVDLEAATAVSAGVSGVVGVDYCKLEVKGSGSVDLSVEGTAKKDGNALKFIGSYNASPLTFGIKVYAKVFSLTCELYETDESNKPTFGSPVSGPINRTIYTFP